MSYADPAQEAARVARLAYALGFMGRGIRMLEKRRLYRELTFTPPECHLSSEEIGKKVNELYEFDRLRQAAQVTWWGCFDYWLNMRNWVHADSKVVHW